MLITKRIHSLLEHFGWIVECESPLEICHEETQARATGVAAERIIEELTISRDTWLPIETAPDERTMFVVIAIDIHPITNSTYLYTSDPRCVWKNEDGTFERWPHPYPPTHWCPLPNTRNFQ